MVTEKKGGGDFQHFSINRTRTHLFEPVRLLGRHLGNEENTNLTASEGSLRLYIPRASFSAG